MSSGPRFSGLQKDVFALYRTLLRAARKKETTPDMHNKLTNVVRIEFREEAKKAGRNDFRKIEHMIRYGHKQKKLLEMPGFTGATVIRK